MTTRWFGEPWPSEDLRAPVCESDADKVELPKGTRCYDCGQEITSTDSGVVSFASFDIPHSFALDDGNVVAAHLQCFLLMILGPRFET